jgi:hypothetical protein
MVAESGRRTSLFFQFNELKHIRNFRETQQPGQCENDAGHEQDKNMDARGPSGRKAVASGVGERDLDQSDVARHAVRGAAGRRC